MVRLTDRPDMTLDVYRGRKTTMQQQQICINRDVLKDHIRVRAGDHDNKVDDDFEEEFEVEHLISHLSYDGKLYVNL